MKLTDYTTGGFALTLSRRNLVELLQQLDAAREAPTNRRLNFGQIALKTHPNDPRLRVHVRVYAEEDEPHYAHRTPKES